MDRAGRILKSDYQSCRALLALHRGETSDLAFAGALLMLRVARVTTTPPKKKPQRRRG
jgi:hypothetical protein